MTPDTGNQFYQTLRGYDAPCGYTLAGLVAEICDRAGLPFDRYDVSKLDGFVLGMMLTSDHPAFTGIRQLSEAYFFDPVNHSGRIHFQPRGGEAEFEINPDELTEDSEDETTKKDGQVPRVMHLEYYDLEGQQEPNKQSSDRSIYIRENAEAKLSTPIVMRADDAARVVTIIHKVAIEEQRGQITFELPDSYLFLTVGDLVRLNGIRLRIYEIRIDEGFQVYKATHDRASAYQSSVPALRPPAIPEQDLVPGETVMAFLDVPSLRSGDDSLGYYFAVAGQSQAWRGAQVQLSTDGGENYIASRRTTTSAIIGVLDEPCGPGPRYIPDQHNTLRVRMLTYGGALELATLREMMNRLNLAVLGNEVIAFGEAEQDAEDEDLWHVSYMLRGRKHTDPIGHPAGTQFVLFDDDDVAPFLPAQAYELGADLRFRATTFETTTQTTMDATFTGRSQIEPPPGYLRTRREGGNLTITWVGTGTRGGKTAVQQSAAFTGYRVTVGSTIHDTTETSLTVTDPGAGVTVSVSQLNSITGPGLTTETET